jgi:hypothetical protein
MRLFQNFSFGTATLDLIEKADFRPFFRKPVPKPTEFWNRLEYMRLWQKLIWAHFRMCRKLKALRCSAMATSVAPAEDG